MKRSLLAVWAFAATVLAQDPEKLRDRVAERLAELGYEVPDDVTLERRTEAQIVEDLDGQLDLLFRPTTTLGQYWLYRSFGIEVGADPAELRRLTVRATAKGFSAYYEPSRKRFVLLDTTTRELAELFGGGLEPLIAHELVHAHQDTREGGIAGFFARGTRTLDDVTTRRCMIEGEAELVSLACLVGTSELAEIEADDLEQTELENLLAGESGGAIYGQGRQFVLREFQRDGWDAVRGTWTDVPPSTEQVLHPSKLGRDEPAAVTLPRLPREWQLLHEDTFGELQISTMLRAAGVARKTSTLASIGWDGDRLGVFDGPGERVVVVWRSVWDRELDAKQFADAVRAAKGRDPSVDGRVVDWVYSPSSELARTASAALRASRKQPEPDAGDAATTAAAEQLALDRDRSSRSENYWTNDSVGLKVPIADDWEIREVRGMTLLMHSKPAASGFATNINVQVMPARGIRDAETLLDVNRQGLENMATLELDSIELEERGGVELVVGEYHGTVPGNASPLHFLLLMYLRDGKQIIVTATTLQSTWSEFEAPLRKIMAGVVVDP